jgi:uncharacterized damage-inducible protein DinB
MIDPAYVRRMARYNRWQNQNLIGVADRLSDEERRRERGAFFGSIHNTLSHLMWADQIWMSRLTDMPAPKGGILESLSLYPEWELLRNDRTALDGRIISWADGLDEAALAGDLTWHSAVAKREVGKPTWLLVTHMFNHQTHHRGQVHCMLTQAGGEPHDTNLVFMPE